MRKICEPNEIAFEPESANDYRDQDEAIIIRSKQFWDYILEDDEDKTSAIQYILNYLAKETKLMAEAPLKCNLNLWGVFEEITWGNIKQIIAFNTSYYYYSEEENDEVSDYLDYEGGVRYDVIKAFTSYILEGAALAKRVGSPAYDKWVDALVMLKDEYNGSKNYKSVDLVAEAYARTWGDVHAWIHINGYDKFKKTKKKGKNKKK